MTPTLGLILGSGLGELADEMEEATTLSYEEIPHFPVSTVVGHDGKLVIGTLGGQKLVAMKGRFHYYEGYSMKEVTFPVGVQTLIVTNACGALNDRFSPGDLMIITDHINMTGTNPLIGPNDERLGPRFPDMSNAYNKELVQLVKEAAKRVGIPIKTGVYAGITGPNYMTGAELIMLRRLGADAVGMSTVPEVIGARHAGLEVIGISCITDMAIGEEIEGISHEEVVDVANRTKPTFIRLMKEIIRSLQ